MKNRIAIFANRGSKQAALLGELVAEQGAEPLLMGIQLGGTGRTPVSLRAGESRWGGVDFKEIRAIHVRCTAPNTLPTLPPVLNSLSYSRWRDDFLREQSFQAVAYAFFQRMRAEGKLVVNPLTTYVEHNTKGQFYQRLRDAGFPVPTTLTTNDPEAARSFLEEQPGVVVKPAIGVGSTREVTVDDLSRFDEFRQTPVLLQEYVRGNTVRVHVVADKVVLALKILSETVDSRTHQEGFEYLRLPDEVEARLVAANRYLGLHYAAWDIIAAADGRHVFLDCNPGPFVLWIGDQFSRVVLGNLARYLVGFAETGSEEEAARAVVPWENAS